MKTAIPMHTKNKTDKISDVFGRCAYLAIYNHKTKEISFIDNPGASQAGGAGIATAQEIINNGASAVVTENIGPNAENVLNEASIEVILKSGKSLQEVIDTLPNNT